MELEVSKNNLRDFCKTKYSEIELTGLDGVFDYMKENSSIFQFKNHEKCFQIAKILASDLSLGFSSVCASVIYCYCTNPSAAYESIEKKMGSEVASIFIGVTKIPFLDIKKFSAQSENFIKLLLTISEDIRGILIKLAEVIYKMRFIEQFGDDERKEILTMSSILFAPLSHRLGLYALKTEMEEMVLKYSKPEIFRSIAQKLNETKAKRDKYIADFISPLKALLAKNKIDCEIKGRPKSIYSIWNKMNKQGVDFEEVYDLFAIRIITKSDLENEKQDCWRVYSLITDLYTSNPHRLRDWISTPKSSGYESLHATVIGPENNWVEVQIRTTRMDEIAEKGQAAHWKYKESSTKQSGDNWMSKVRELLQKPDDVLQKENSDAKAALYTDEIFIFTPKGDLRKSKRDYTVLDFAFEIHTEIGAKCTGAMVNDKFCSIRQVLKNGDVVKVMTSKTQHPQYQWLEFVKSTKVKQKIKKALKEEEYKGLELGKDLIKQKFSQMKLAFNDENIAKVVSSFSLKNPQELYQGLADGKIDIHKVKKAFNEQIEQKLESLNDLKTNTEFLENTIFSKSDKVDFLLIDNNLSTIDYQFAKCCNPIRGDAVFGFVTVSKGTKIHKTICPNAKDLVIKFPYRVIKAQWTHYDENASFIATIRITGRDSMGVASHITQIISTELKLNMKSVSITEKKNSMFDGMIVVYVKGTQQLDAVIERIKRVKDILEVTRVN